MIHIIIAFPKLENARSIKGILSRSGYPVTGVCTSGAHVLQYVNELSEGIVICGSRLTDMVYDQLYQDMPHHFRMLLLASPAVCAQETNREISSLSMPLKVHELMEQVDALENELARQKRRRRQVPRSRSSQEQEAIDRAKGLLMEQQHMTEEEAHRYMQKTSMDSGLGMVETAQKLLELCKKL